MVRPHPKPCSQLRTELEQLTGYAVYPQSIILHGDALFALAREGIEKKLLILSQRDEALMDFEGERQAVENDGSRSTLLICPLSAANAAALRLHLPFTRPRTLGLATSAGCGDRLGLATPGHIRALRDTGLAPILAQQSMRENARTHRTPQEVIDDATWAVLQEGWRDGYGADADHLMTTDHVDQCVAAGYTFFTVDPGAHVNNEAHSAEPARLAEIYAELPWDGLEISPDALRARYAGQTFVLDDDLTLAFDDETLMRAAGKYGGAIAHTSMMYRHLRDLTDDFELEMSVDETETVTSPEEHFFVVNELKRLGVEWISLAPRYVGSFEKGVDYIGDLDEFEASLAQHAAIARHMGPYKLSIHSGSDKFSVYPAYMRQTGGVVHLKTAGTSYLEALRAIAGVDPMLFRAILELAIDRYPTDRATYHVSALLDNVADPATVEDEELAGYLDQFDAREVLHVTFGSALDAYRDQILDVLRRYEEEHYATLQAHFERHFEPFIAQS